MGVAAWVAFGVPVAATVAIAVAVTASVATAVSVARAVSVAVAVASTVSVAAGVMLGVGVSVACAALGSGARRPALNRAAATAAGKNRYVLDFTMTLLNKFRLDSLSLPVYTSRHGPQDAPAIN
jgi:hypothetical protein